MKKVCRVFVICVLIASLVIFVLHFVKQMQSGLGNGLSARYGKELQALSDELCSEAKNDEEKVMIFYRWIMENIEYDYEFDAFYQHFDVSKTLRTKKGICFDYANLFAAFCRSQNIKCYILDGYLRRDPAVQHAWNRVYMNGEWWNLDVTSDAISSRKGDSLYGFHKIASYDAESEEFVITRIY